MVDLLPVHFPRMRELLMHPWLPAGITTVIVGSLLIFYIGLVVNLSDIDGAESDLKENPYLVTTATGRSEMLLMELKSLDERLVEGDSLHTEGLLNRCVQTKECLREPLEVIADSYRGNLVQAQDVDRHYEELAVAQTELERLMRNGAFLQDAERYYETSVMPKIDDLISWNSTILDDSTQSLDRNYGRAADARAHVLGSATVLIVVVFLALGLFLVILHMKNHEEACLIEGYRKASVDEEEANREKTRFLSNISHDIRTPLSAVIGLMDIVRDHKDEPERVVECASKAEQASRHMLALVNGVLDMSKIESGLVPMRPSVFSLGALIDNLITIVKPQADAKRIDLIVVCEESLTTKVVTDEMRLEQVLINLLANAVKYTPDGGTVRFFLKDEGKLSAMGSSKNKDSLPTQEEAERKGGSTFESMLNAASCSEARIFSFAVEDTGMGMSREFVSRVFEPFEREGTAVDRKIEGTGLGMSIARKLVESMGGSISVESEVGVGSCFVVEMPLGIASSAEDAVEEVATPEESGRDASPCFDGGSDGSGGGHQGDDAPLREGTGTDYPDFRILVAEDDLLNAEIASELFGQLGVQVDHVWDGIEAMSAVVSRPSDFYDALFMDIQMPHMGGIEAARELVAWSKETQRKHPPIIAMTANAYEDDRQLAREAGMVGCIVKPFGVSDLRVALERHVSQRHVEKDR